MRRVFLLPKSSKPEGPTPREIQVADYLSRGYGIKLTAHELGITISTVSSHLGHLYPKIGAQNAPHMVRIMIEKGYLPLD